MTCNGLRDCSIIKVRKASAVFFGGKVFYTFGERKNNMYLTETHLHVSEVSPCAGLSAAESVKLYHDRGYSTIFVSDHLNQRFLDSLPDVSWEDKITVFLSGYFKAKEAGRRLNMNILMSAEVMLKDSPNHYLLYGVTREFLNNTRDICNKTIEEFSRIARADNVFVVQAHPFRDNVCFPTAEYVDGIEVFNSNPRHSDYSERSQELAEKYRLYVTAGSDCHRLDDVGRTGIITEQEIKTSEDFVRVIKSGTAEIFRG